MRARRYDGELGGFEDSSDSVEAAGKGGSSLFPPKHKCEDQTLQMGVFILFLGKLAC